MTKLAGAVPSILSLIIANCASAQDVPLPRHALVFAAHSDAARKDYDIWRMSADGSQLASVVVESGQQSQFAVSPDGNEIVYSTRDSNGTSLWRRKFTRGKAVRLTDGKAVDSGPTFSPDGKRLAFFSTRDAKKPDLYVMNLGDSSVTRLTNNELHDSGASWSPDGTAIVFTRYFPKSADKYDGAGEVMQLEIKSGKESQLTKLGGYNGGVCHSPTASVSRFTVPVKRVSSCGQ